MIKIIETNISFDDKNDFCDHQSRIIEVESWEEYINEIKEAKCVLRDGTMSGCSVPRNAEITDLKYDDYHLSCYIYNYLKTKTLRLVYKLNY